MVLSRRTLRRMDNIKDFCDFDTTNKIATLKLNFKSVWELIDERLSSIDEPVAVANAAEIFEQYLEYVPKEFKVNFQITFSDYSGYDPKKIEASIEKSMEVRDYRQKMNYGIKQSKMSAFVVVGLIMLLFCIFNSRYKWFAFVGLPFSATIAFVIELFFELYFEEGMSYFVVTGIYDAFSREDRFGKIIIQQS